MACLRLNRKHRPRRGDGLLRPSKPKGRQRQRPLSCECGRPAVTVVLVTLGEPGCSYLMRMPLCAKCLKLEQEMWKT
jgi:hypothetical protein